MTTTQKQLDFIAIGDITTDTFIQLNAGAFISKNKEGDEQLCVGFGDKIEYDDVTVVRAVGNSPNATTAATRLGLNAALITDMGNDKDGDETLAQLKTNNVSTEFVKRHTNKKTNHNYILRHNAERTILVKHHKYDYTLPTITEPPHWIYFSSVGEDSIEYHHELAKFLRKNPSTKLAFQPGSMQIRLGYEILKDLYETTEIFFCNKKEAQRILDTKESDMKALLTQFRALGPKIAVITDGPNGAFAQDDTGSYSLPMYPDPKPPVDRTGAGDSFSSTVTSMLALGMSLPDALMRGPINSMSVVQYIGAQEGLLSREKIEEYLKNAPSDYIIREL